MFCTRCGSNITDKAVFCPKCGANVSDGQMSVQEYGADNVCINVKKKRRNVIILFILVVCLIATATLILFLYGNNANNKRNTEITEIENGVKADNFISDVEALEIKSKEKKNDFIDSNFAESYVSSIMDASYKGEFEHYISMTDSSEESGEEIYNSTVTYFANSLAYYCEVYTEDISEELYAEYITFAEELLAKAKYTVSSSEIDEDSCYITVSINPMNLLEQIESDINECVDSYNTALETIEFETITDKKYRELEDNYAKNVLDILKENSKTLEYNESVDYIIEIIIDDEGYYAPINEDSWNVIDDYVMGLSDKN